MSHVAVEKELTPSQQMLLNLVLPKLHIKGSPMLKIDRLQIGPVKKNDIVVPEVSDFMERGPPNRRNAIDGIPRLNLSVRDYQDVALCTSHQVWSLP
jgi:hypothetical protein